MRLLKAAQERICFFIAKMRMRARIRRAHKQVKNLKKWYASGDPQQRLKALRNITRRPGESDEAYRQRIQKAVLKGDIFDE